VLGLFFFFFLVVVVVVVVWSPVLELMVEDWLDWPLWSVVLEPIAPEPDLSVVLDCPEVLGWLV